MPLPGWDWPNRTGSRSGQRWAIFWKTATPFSPETATRPTGPVPPVLRGKGQPAPNLHHAAFPRRTGAAGSPAGTGHPRRRGQQQKRLHAARSAGAPGRGPSALLRYRRRPGRRPKPDPEGILAAVAALNLTPDQVLYCGDTILDAQAASAPEPISARFSTAPRPLPPSRLIPAIILPPTLWT